MAKSSVTTQSITPLDADDTATLLFMLEEEKLAGDVYELLYDLYGNSVFANIAASEDNHYAALLTQAELLDLDVSAIEANAAGVFVNPDLQAMYDSLIAWGSNSETDALLVGVAIEETDIADIAAAIVDVEGTTLASVYQNLLDGSYNHLDAFETAVTALDPAILFGTEGDDVIDGTAADNVIYARGGDDLVAGLSGADTLYGGTGDDTLDGDNGRDRLYGEAGRDKLIGGDGNDRLFGGAGRDRLIGGDGNDRLRGGTRADDFVFRDGFGTDRILDFDAVDNGEDIVLRQVASIRSYSDLVAHHLFENADGDAVIDDGHGNTITLVGVALDDLGKGDFLF